MRRLTVGAFYLTASDHLYLCTAVQQDHKAIEQTLQ